LHFIEVVACHELDLYHGTYHFHSVHHWPLTCDTQIVSDT
jgi:hypothetical protein